MSGLDWLLNDVSPSSPCCSTCHNLQERKIQNDNTAAATESFLYRPVSRGTDNILEHVECDGVSAIWAGFQRRLDRRFTDRVLATAVLTLDLFQAESRISPTETSGQCGTVREVGPVTKNQNTETIARRTRSSLAKRSSAQREDVMDIIAHDTGKVAPAEQNVTSQSALKPESQVYHFADMILRNEKIVCQDSAVKKADKKSQEGGRRPRSGRAVTSCKAVYQKNAKSNKSGRCLVNRIKNETCGENGDILVILPSSRRCKGNAKVSGKLSGSENSESTNIVRKRGSIVSSGKRTPGQVKVHRELTAGVKTPLKDTTLHCKVSLNQHDQNNSNVCSSTEDTWDMTNSFKKKQMSLSSKSCRPHKIHSGLRTLMNLKLKGLEMSDASQSPTVHKPTTRLTPCHRVIQSLDSTQAACAKPRKPRQRNRKGAEAADVALCSYCGCVFDKHWKLELHMAKEHSDGPVLKDKECKQCGEHFYTDHILKKHVSVHHAEKAVCRVCGRLVRTSTMWEHMNYVHKEPRFRCQLCSFTTSRQYHLRRHVSSVHDKLRNYTCSHTGCSSVFACKSSLAKHIEVIHDKIRRYDCTWPNCSRSFSRSHHLKRHELRHTGEKPIHCDICSYTCRQQNSLRLHKKKKHGEHPEATQHDLTVDSPAPPQSDVTAVSETNTTVQDHSSLLCPLLPAKLHPITLSALPVFTAPGINSGLGALGSGLSSLTSTSGLTPVPSPVCIQPVSVATVSQATVTMDTACTMGLMSMATHIQPSVTMATVQGSLLPPDLLSLSQLQSVTSHLPAPSTQVLSYDTFQEQPPMSAFPGDLVPSYHCQLPAAVEPGLTASTGHAPLHSSYQSPAITQPGRGQTQPGTATQCTGYHSDII